MREMKMRITMLTTMFSVLKIQVVARKAELQSPQNMTTRRKTMRTKTTTIMTTKETQTINQ